MTPECGTDCQEALKELQLFLDGELPETSVSEISQHLADCYPCADRADFESQLRAIVRRDCVEEAPPSLISRIRERLDATGA